MKRISKGIMGTEQSKSVNRIGCGLEPDMGGLTALSTYLSTGLEKPQERSTIFVKAVNTDLPKPWEDESVYKLLSVLEMEAKTAISQNPFCRHVSSWNGTVWAAFIDNKPEDTDTIYNTAVAVNSAVMVINRFAEKYGYPILKVGVGLSYGNVRLTQASKKLMTSTEMWVGEGINSAEKVAGVACAEGDIGWEICTDESFFCRLPEERRTRSFTDMRSSKVSAAMLEEYEEIV